MIQSKPHLYKVKDQWYCKLYFGGRTLLGAARASPKDAYLWVHNYYLLW